MAGRSKPRFTFGRPQGPSDGEMKRFDLGVVCHAYSQSMRCNRMHPFAYVPLYTCLEIETEREREREREREIGKQIAR